MAKQSYVVQVEGRNCFLESDDGLSRVGFYATRCITADSADEAGRQTVAHVRHELLRSLRNPVDIPPSFHVVEVKKLGWWRRLFPPQFGGYTFFIEDDNAD